VTVHDRLLELGADPRETSAAEALLARFVPFGRPVVLTEDVLAAARAGDAALVATLLAEEVEPDEDDLAALRELDAGAPADSERTSIDDLRTELGLPRP
jgi:hypothetical protein